MMNKHEPVLTSPAADAAGRRVLCVDLDGTLVATDLLWESVLALLREQPWTLVRFPGWLLQGKAHLKREIAARVQLNPGSLPYREDLLRFLRQEREAGRELVLATAADERAAVAVAQHLGIFSAVIASDGVVNLSGARKCQALEERYGCGQFDYAGNGYVDLPLWRSARAAILVAPPRRLIPKVHTMSQVEAVFSGTSPRLRTLLAALRVPQWVKNLLIFVPVLLDHRLLDIPVLASALLAFIAFCLAASGGYVLNDVLDVESDRLHPRKRSRPFAAGTLSLATGVALIPLLFLSAFGLAVLALPRLFLLLLCTYVVLTIAYSFYLKRFAVLDVLLLAGLYTLRVLAGIAATEVRFSTWLLAFSMFLFLSLAFLKRYTELSRTRSAAAEPNNRRGYVGEDLEWLGSMGSASGYLSVLVLALYVNSEEVTVLYRSPFLLWLICPLLLYWISRMWLLAYRRKIDEDPIVATVRDPFSYVVGLLVAGVLLLAI